MKHGKERRERWMIRNRLTVLACMAVFVTLLAFALGAPALAQEGSGRLVVYSAAPLDFAESLKRAFEALHPGMTVEIVNPALAETIIAKLAAARHYLQADLFHSCAVFESLVAAKMGL